MSPPSLDAAFFDAPDFVTAGDRVLAHVATGPADGPLALFVHGFPDAPITWRHHLPVVADLGYRAVAIWLPGYSPSQVPPERAVDLDGLARDLDALHESLGGDDRAVLVAHDWGAVLGWRAAAQSPQRWSRLVALAIPPMAALRGIRRDPRQMARLWYQFAVQVPGAEQAILAGDGAALWALWERWSPGHPPTPAHRAAVLDALGGPGSARAALGYYRGLLGDVLVGAQPDPAEPVPTQPVLYLHGREDGCFRPRWAERTRGLLGAGSRVTIVPDAGHFVHLDAPEVVSEELRRFLGLPAA